LLHTIQDCVHGGVPRIEILPGFIEFQMFGCAFPARLDRPMFIVAEDHERVVLLCFEIFAIQVKTWFVPVGRA